MTHGDKKRPLPKLRSDVEAEAFVVQSAVTEFDLSKLVPVRFELKRKHKPVNLREKASKRVKP